MNFEYFSKKLATLEETASRNEMTAMLAGLFADLSKDEIKPACYMALGRLAPLYERVEFNLAEKMVFRAIGVAYGVEVAEVRKTYKEVGDLGEVALMLYGDGLSTLEKETLSRGVRDDTSGMESLPDVSVSEVYDALIQIAKDGGEGSQERKVEGLAKLLQILDGLSAKYVVRIVLGKLRLGFSDKTILDALSMMEMGDKSGRKKIEAAYQLLPDVGAIATLVKAYGIAHVAEHVSVTVGVPVIPALAQRLKTANEMIKKMGKVAVEPKYDGTRVQIHYSSDGSIRTFTRNLDENSHMFPELSDGISQIQADSVILDGEAIGYDPETGELLPFQMTITRKRKHGIAEASKAVPLKFFVFDLLYVDGESLVDEPFSKRRARLEEVIGDGDALVVDDMEVTDDPERLRVLHKGYLDDGLEGAVIKKIDGPYTPGRRGWNWVKFKEVEDSTGKLSDTLDVVVLGYYQGRGKRSAFGIGAFLVGIADGEGYKTLAKIGTGLSDEQWKEMKRRLDMQVTAEKPGEYVVDKQLACDVWVDPQVVVEVAADEITDSPTHSAGIALRFPRLVKFRDDKRVEQTTSLEEIKRIRETSN